jgi:hypothetical protein
VFRPQKALKKRIKFDIIIHLINKRVIIYDRKMEGKKNGESDRINLLAPEFGI